MGSIGAGRLLFKGSQATLHECQGIEGNVLIKVIRSVQYTLTDKDTKAGVPPDTRVPKDEFEAMLSASQAASAFNCENLVTYVLIEALCPHSFGIVMPRLAGDLRMWLQARKSVDEDTLLHVAHQLVSALLYLHHLGVCHLDISASNVLVKDLKAERPECQLADLETSTASGRSPSRFFLQEFASPERVACEGAGAGTAAPVASLVGSFSAAPCVIGVPVTLDYTKCDVWSLGMLLFSVGAHHEFPGIVDGVPDLGNVSMNHASLTPSRIAAVVSRDLRHCSEPTVSLITMMLNHDQKTRPTMESVMENIEAIQRWKAGGSVSTERVLPFPYTLGPFALHELPSVDVRSVARYSIAGMYDAHVNCPLCGTKRSTTKQARSTCAATNMAHIPAHLSPAAQELLPCVASSAGSQAANRMCFMYPFVCSSGTIVRTPSDALVLHGGFGLFLDSGPVEAVDRFERVWVMAAADDKSLPSHPIELRFTAAQPWPSTCTRSLYTQGRFHADVPSCLGTGTKVHNFCWLLPNEKLQLDNGEWWVAAPFGAFAFLFNENPLEPHHLDRFFAVAEPIQPRLAPLSSIKRMWTGLFGKKKSSGSPVSPASSQKGPGSSPLGAASQPGYETDSVPSQSLPFAVYGSSMPLRAAQDGSSLVAVDGAPPKTFRISLTGEVGSCAPPAPLSSSAARAFFAPPNAVSVVFCRIEYAANKESGTYEKLLPQHGFFFLDDAFNVVGLLAFHFVAAQSEAPPATGSTCCIPLSREGPLQSYKGTLAPAEIYEPAHEAGYDTADGFAWFGFDHLTNTMYFSDERKEKWIAGKVEM